MWQMPRGAWPCLGREQSPFGHVLGCWHILLAHPVTSWATGTSWHILGCWHALAHPAGTSPCSPQREPPALPRGMARGTASPLPLCHVQNSQTAEGDLRLTCSWGRQVWEIKQSPGTGSSEGPGPSPAVICMRGHHN